VSRDAALSDSANLDQPDFELYRPARSRHAEILLMANTTLKDLIVVAMEQAVAAPFCTRRLADAGARVIKIERPEGDFARFYDNATPGGSSYFVWLNHGKESVVLDLNEEHARRQLG